MSRLPPRMRLPGRPLYYLLLLVSVVVTLEAVFVVTATTGVGCSSCHVSGDSAEALAQAPHASTDCIACHKPAGLLGAARLNVAAAENLVKWMVPDDGFSRSGRLVSRENCESCHKGLRTGTVQGESSKVRHVDFLEAGYSCSLCHAQSNHSSRPGDARSVDLHSICFTCHSRGGNASGSCKTCHADSFSAETASTKADSSHPSDWASQHGTGDMQTCTSCHDRTYCADCHDVQLPHERGTFIYSHGKEAASAGPACLTCHEQSSCDDCHQIEMPHASQYLQKHGEEAVEAGTPVCATCHLKSGCDRCHLRHVHSGVPREVREKLEQQGVQ